MKKIFLSILLVLITFSTSFAEWNSPNGVTPNIVIDDNKILKSGEALLLCYHHTNIRLEFNGTAVGGYILVNGNRYYAGANESEEFKLFFSSTYKYAVNLYFTLKKFGPNAAKIKCTKYDALFY